MIYYPIIECILRNIVNLIDQGKITNNHLFRFKYSFNPENRQITIRFHIFDVMPNIVKDHYYYNDVTTAIQTINDKRLTYDREQLIIEFRYNVD